MKRHPFKLPKADLSSEHSHELFPRDLLHPLPSELAASPNRVQVLLGEQSDLMKNSHIVVSNARSYLRSPPRRLRVIQDGGLQSPPAAVEEGEVLKTGSRRPLPPISLPIELTASLPQTSANLEQLVQHINDFLRANPDVTKKELQTLVFGKVDDTEDVPHSTRHGAGMDTSLSSMGSNVSSVFDMVLIKCLPHVPRLAARNVAEPPAAYDLSDGKPESRDDDYGEEGESEQQQDGPVTFSPWEGHAALLFVDISGYSAVTAALAPFGPYALSDAVNGYLVQMMSVLVDQYGGDVIKFAGDAILVAWAPTPGGRNEANQSALEAKQALHMCCLRAAACAVTLQQFHSRYEVAIPQSGGTSNTPSFLEFSIHIGVSVGPIETDVFSFPNAKYTETLFHSLSGAALQAVGPAADSAASGEVCLTSSAVDLLTDVSVLQQPPSSTLQKQSPTHKRSLAHTQTMPALTTEEVKRDAHHVGHHGDTKLFKLRTFDTNAANDWIARQRSVSQLRDADADILESKKLKRIAQRFVPPVLLQRFSSSATNVAAEMRFLAVMFISKSDRDASLADWFSEVHQVLDAHSCAVVKLIDDDKGVHVIAAAGLFLSETDASLKAVDAAMFLNEREAGCHVGIASGLTFCGLIGSADYACRWDVTGSACVRSCRLMQQAQVVRPEGCCFVDESVLETISNRAALNEYNRRLELKGSAAPVKVYVLAPRTANPAWLVPSITPALQVSSLCHQEERESFAELIAAGSAQMRRNNVTAATRRASLLQATSSSSALVHQPSSSSHEDGQFLRHCAAVITGPFGVGKRTLASTVGVENGFTVIQHKCNPPVGGGGGDSSPSLAIAETLSRWFAHHASELIREVAMDVGAAFAAGHVGKTRRLLLALVAAVCGSGGAAEGTTGCHSSTLLIIENAQHLDRASLDWARHLLRQRRDDDTVNRRVGNFACVLCVTPTLGSTTASQLIALLRAPMEREAADVRQHIHRSTRLFTLEPVGIEAVRDLATKYFSWDVEEGVVHLIHAQCSGLPLLVASYVRHIMAQRPYVTTMFEDAVVHLSSDAAWAKAESWQWIDVAPSVAPSLMQLCDAAPASVHRTILRVLACLVQPPACGASPDYIGNDGSAIMGVVEHVVRTLLRSTRGGATEAQQEQIFQKRVLEIAAVHLVVVHQPHLHGAVECISSSSLIRLGSVALQNAIFNSITPDYALQVLRLAKSYHEHTLRAPVGDNGVHEGCKTFVALRLAQYRLQAFLVSKRLAARASVLSPGSPSPKQQVPGFSELEEVRALMTTVEGGGLCLACGADKESHRFDGALQRLRRALATAAGDAPAGSNDTTTSGLHTSPPKATISLDVVGLKNYAPPIGLGTATASVMLDICRWMRNVYVALAHRTPVSEKVAGQGQTLSRRLATCLKALARTLQNIRGAPHPMLSDTHSASLSLKSIANYEATLNTIVSDLFLQVVKDDAKGATAAAEACKLLLQFFSQRMVPCALAFQEAVPELLELLVAPPLPPPATTTTTTSANSSSGASLTAQLDSLWSGVRIYQTVAKEKSAPKQSSPNASNNNFVMTASDGGDAQEAPDAAGGSIATFHVVFMALATSNFAPNNPRASLAWVRDRVLHQRVENGRSFRSCVVSDYVCTLAAATAMAQSRQQVVQ